MKFKKFLAMILALAMAVSVMTVSVSAAQLSDINGHWAETSIQRWADAGIINGYEDGTFKPGNPIKRAEFATILAKTLGLSGTTETKFSDVSGHWAEKAIYACAAAGIVGGYPDGTFLPEKNITREEAMKMYSEAIKIVGESGTDAASYLKDKFTDGAAVSSWASGYAYSMVSNGAMEGSNGELRPKANITRAEVAIILDRLAGVYVSKDGTVSTTTAEQQAKGYMGNSIVVHYDATATVTADQDGNVQVQVGETITEVKLDKAPTLIYDNKDHDLEDNQVAIKPGDITIGQIPEEAPTDPSTAPTEPSTEPSTEATEPSSEATNPTTDSTEPSEPDERTYYQDLIIERVEDTKQADMDEVIDVQYVTKYTYDETHWQVIKVEDFCNGEQINTRTAELDEQGRPIKIVNEQENRIHELKYEEEKLVEETYSKDGILEAKISYAYDANGNTIEEHNIDYSSDGNVSMDIVYTWEYDDRGELLKRTIYYNGKLDEEYIYTYDENGTILKEEETNYGYTEENVAYVVWYSVDTYENGRIIGNKRTVYNPDGTVSSSEEFTRVYNDTGYTQTNLADGELNKTIIVEYTFEERGEGENYVYVDTTTSTHYDPDGKEIHKDVEVYTSSDTGYSSVSESYDLGVFSHRYEHSYDYETGEYWSKEYGYENQLLYCMHETVEEFEGGHKIIIDEDADWGAWDSVETYKTVEVWEDYDLNRWYNRYY